MAISGTRGSRRRPRCRTLGAALVAVVLLASGCLVPPTFSQSVVAYGGDGPDPALAPDVPDTSYAFLYTTDSGSYHVPACLTRPGTSATLCGHDALPSPPVQNYPPASGQQELTWAPTVRYLYGEYLMMFSESISSDPGRANCIGAATSSNGITFTPVDTWTFCSGTRYIGFLDPYLFSDPSTGDTYLLYSRQWCTGTYTPSTGCSGTPGSEIDSVRIDAAAIEDGSADCPFPVSDCGYVGYNYRLVSFPELASYDGDTDSNSYVENPAIVGDPDNGYDLTVSYGTWSQPNYETIELPCLLPYGDCIPDTGAVLLTQNGNQITGGGSAYFSPGGMSYLYDSSPTADVTVWHSYEFPGDPDDTAREVWTGPTTLFDGDGVFTVYPVDPPTVGPFVAGHKHDVLPLTLATTDPPGLIQDHWALRGLPPDG